MLSADIAELKIFMAENTGTVIEDVARERGDRGSAGRFGAS